MQNTTIKTFSEHKYGLNFCTKRLIERHEGSNRRERRSTTPKYEKPGKMIVSDLGKGVFVRGYIRHQYIPKNERVPVYKNGIFQFFKTQEARKIEHFIEI